MLMNNVITKANVKECLEKIFINKPLLQGFMTKYKNITDFETEEKLFFALYNEYITADEYLDSDTMTDDYTYADLKQYFFRDYVTTLTRENYKDRANMKDQMDIVYDALNNDEKELLDDNSIDKSNFTDLIRMQADTNDNTIELSVVEQDNTKLNIFSDLVNNSSLFRNVLNKISRGTIH